MALLMAESLKGTPAPMSLVGFSCMYVCIYDDEKKNEMLFWLTFKSFELNPGEKKKKKK
jgi:hypothetical protein